MTNPNPMVGAVVVKTKDSGRGSTAGLSLHAEADITQAGARRIDALREPGAVQPPGQDAAVHGEYHSTE